PLRRRISRTVRPSGPATPGLAKATGNLGFHPRPLPKDAPLIPALEQQGWKVLYRDSTATLLARPNEIALRLCALCLNREIREAPPSAGTEPSAPKRVITDNRQSAKTESPRTEWIVRKSS